MCNWNSSSEKVLRVYVVFHSGHNIFMKLESLYDPPFPRGKTYGPRNQQVEIGLAIIFSDSLADFASHKIWACRDGKL